MLELKRQTLQVDDHAIALQPGMGLTADLHLRSRRFIAAITDLFDNKRPVWNVCPDDLRNPHPLWQYLPAERRAC